MVPRMEPFDKETRELQQFFEYAHLREDLQAASKPFHAVAAKVFAGEAPDFASLSMWMLDNLSDNPQRERALLKVGTAARSSAADVGPGVWLHSLIEAKDCSVRARFYKFETVAEPAPAAADETVSNA